MKTIAYVIAISMAFSTAGALASDGTITINGNLTANTCTINAGYGNITVNLPTISTATLNTAGKTAGNTKFTIALSNCTGSSAQTYFEAGATINTANGHLINASGSAGNVEVQILNDQNQAINLSTQTNSQQVSIVSQAATMNYYAQYYATGVATAGTVITSVKYSMIYN